jgi:predicted PurR-regulated permease PerM
MSTPERPSPMRSKSPFVIGLAGAAGVAVTYGLVQLIVGARDVLVLIGLGFFLAVGLEPAVAWLARHRFPRWAGVTVVFGLTLALFLGFLALTIAPVVEQATQFVNRVPDLLREAQDSNSALGQLNQRFQLQQRIEQAVSGDQTALVTGLLGAGRVVFNAVTSTVIVIVLTAYFLAELPRIRLAGYRLVPRSRRERTEQIGDEIFDKIGAYVLGNVLVSLIAGGTTFIWLIIFGVPYALLLSLTVAILDLIPAVGSSIAGVLVTLVALTVSLPVAIATAAFFVVYQAIENYLLVPKIMGRVVQVPAVLTVVAVLIGGALLGVLGALVAIPAAAAVLLVLRKVAVPRLDRS